MIHNIIVKFNDDIDHRRKTEIAAQAKELFDGLRAISGIHDVAVHTSCIDRANRYDMLIAISMDKDALPTYDDSAIHHTWKANYGKFIKNKAIFDYE